MLHSLRLFARQHREAHGLPILVSRVELSCGDFTLGGRQSIQGWEILDAIERPGVDHVGDARDLSRFADGTFGVMYASHVVEHFDYKNELQTALAHWRRALVPGGTLYVSVPDLDTLAELFLLRDSLELRRPLDGDADRFSAATWMLSTITRRDSTRSSSGTF